jgi:hypothetical protein
VSQGKGDLTNRRDASSLGILRRDVEPPTKLAAELPSSLPAQSG